MNLRRKQEILMLALASVLGACVGARGPALQESLAKRGTGIVGVLPVVNSTGRRLQAPEVSLLHTFGSKETPEAIVQNYVMETLRGQGVRAVVLADVARGVEAPLAVDRDVDAFLRVRILRWDTALIRTMHRMVIELEAEVLSGDRVVWHRRSRQPVIDVSTHGASRDYRQYVWRAVESLLG